MRNREVLAELRRIEQSLGGDITAVEFSQYSRKREPVGNARVYLLRMFKMGFASRRKDPSSATTKPPYRYRTTKQGRSYLGNLRTGKKASSKDAGTRKDLEVVQELKELIQTGQYRLAEAFYELKRERIVDPRWRRIADQWFELMFKKQIRDTERMTERLESKRMADTSVERGEEPVTQGRVVTRSEGADELVRETSVGTQAPEADVPYVSEVGSPYVPEVKEPKSRSSEMIDLWCKLVDIATGVESDDGEGVSSSENDEVERAVSELGERFEERLEDLEKGSRLAFDRNATMRTITADSSRADSSADRPRRIDELLEAAKKLKEERQARRDRKCF